MQKMQHHSIQLQAGRPIGGINMKIDWFIEIIFKYNIKAPPVGLEPTTLRLH